MNWQGNAVVVHYGSDRGSVTVVQNTGAVFISLHH